MIHCFFSSIQANESQLPPAYQYILTFNQYPSILVVICMWAGFLLILLYCTALNCAIWPFFLRTNTKFYRWQQKIITNNLHHQTAGSVVVIFSLRVGVQQGWINYRTVCHVSGVSCQVLIVTCHTSHVNYHIVIFKKKLFNLFSYFFILHIKFSRQILKWLS